MKRIVYAVCPLLLVLGVVLLPNSPEGTNARAFSVNGPVWSGTSTTYFVNPNFPDASAGTTAQQIAAVQRGASEWKSAGQTPFQFLYGGQTSSTTTNASDGVNNVYYKGGDGSGALAVCFYSFIGATLIGFDIEFYDNFGSFDFIWAVNPNSSQFDIDSVATHEFGHALGLGHSAVAAATMFPSVSAGSTVNRSLDADDIAGVQSLYGTQATGLPSISSISPAFAWIGGGTRITITGTNIAGGDTQSIQFDGIAATDVTVIDNTKVECTLPAGTDPGACNVVFTHAQGSVTSTNGFFYQGARVTQPISITTIGEIELLFPSSPSKDFGAAPAYGFQQGIALSRFNAMDARVLPLNDDALFESFLVGQLNSVFTDFSGTLDVSGRAYIHVDCPFDGRLVGFYFIVAGVAFDDNAVNGIGSISNALTVTIQN